MLRLFRISAFVLTFLIATASSLTSKGAAEHPVVPAGAAAVGAVAISSIDVADRLEVSARQSFEVQPHAVHCAVDSCSLSALPLKTHRSSERIAAAGHVKFRHASNAPPAQLC